MIVPGRGTLAPVPVPQAQPATGSESNSTWTIPISLARDMEKPSLSCGAAETLDRDQVPLTLGP